MHENSALKNLLLALVPYSRQNMMLSFSPNRFFNELEKSSGHSQKSLRQASSRAIKKGLLKDMGTELRLTELGKRVVEPFIAKYLKGSKLMVIFDIPEIRLADRQKLRILLRQWEFKQIQKSVWISEHDHIKSVKLAVRELELDGYVRLYECSPVFPRST